MPVFSHHAILPTHRSMRRYRSFATSVSFRRVLSSVFSLFSLNSSTPVRVAEPAMVSDAEIYMIRMKELQPSRSR